MAKKFSYSAMPDVVDEDQNEKRKKMKPITEKIGEHEVWYKEAKQQTLESLPTFIRHLTEDYQHDYGTICHAVTAAAIAAAYVANKTPQGGITGFQAGAVMWEFMQNWDTSLKDKPLKLINTWQWLKNEAQKKLDDGGVLHPDVKKHLESIINGIIPFGFKVE